MKGQLKKTEEVTARQNTIEKQVRQNYIKRRLVTTYKALQRFSQSEVDLETGVGTAGGSTAATAGPGAAGVKIDGGGRDAGCTHSPPSCPRRV
ncbi:hypothetical protein Pmani_005783 [Petrolisthes manimaculis]|uniref:Uncharacterized protein n=1 Tax=Petrolisthes manimaculis TaxID=1843537 RepID=A0AAE1QBK2_9EUCA|nr:hypothetical protein Pmani_005783 [Petrolisthes manimaculis]